MGLKEKLKTLGVGVTVVGTLTITLTASAFAADNKVQAAANSHIIIEYGEDLKDVDFVAEDLDTLGIQVILQAGYKNPICGLITINGVEKEFNQDSIDGGEVGSYIHRAVQGKKDRFEAPSCEAGTDNHTE